MATSMRPLTSGSRKLRSTENKFYQNRTYHNHIPSATISANCSKSSVAENSWKTKLNFLTSRPSTCSKSSMFVRRKLCRSLASEHHQRGGSNPMKFTRGKPDVDYQNVMQKRIRTNTSALLQGASPKSKSKAFHRLKGECDAPNASDILMRHGRKMTPMSILQKHAVADKQRFWIDFYREKQCQEDIGKHGLSTTVRQQDDTQPAKHAKLLTIVGNPDSLKSWETLLRSDCNYSNRNNTSSTDIARRGKLKVDQRRFVTSMKSPSVTKARKGKVGAATMKSPSVTKARRGNAGVATMKSPSITKARRGNAGVATRKSPSIIKARQGKAGEATNRSHACITRENTAMGNSKKSVGKGHGLKRNVAGNCNSPKASRRNYPAPTECMEGNNCHSDWGGDGDSRMLSYVDSGCLITPQPYKIRLRLKQASCQLDSIKGKCRKQCRSMTSRPPWYGPGCLRNPIALSPCEPPKGTKSNQQIKKFYKRPSWDRCKFPMDTTKRFIRCRKQPSPQPACEMQSDSGNTACSFSKNVVMLDPSEKTCLCPRSPLNDNYVEAGENTRQLRRKQHILRQRKMVGAKEAFSKDECDGKRTTIRDIAGHIDELEKHRWIRYDEDKSINSKFLEERLRHLLFRRL